MTDGPDPARQDPAAGEPAAGDPAPHDEEPHDDGPQGPPAGGASRGHRAPASPSALRRLLTRRRVGVALLVLGGVLVVAGAWLAVTGLLARSRLDAARADLSRLRAAVSAGDLPAARRDLAALRSHAGDAHSLTTGPAWALAADLPAAGRPFETVRGITVAVDQVSRQVLPPLLDARDTLDPGTLRGPDGSIDVARIAAVAPTLDRASSALTRVAGDVRALPGVTAIGAVDRARADLARQLAEVTGPLRTADLVARIVPTMLGADGPRAYFVGFQNNAESRATGGLPGAFGIVTADHGQVRFTSFQADTALDGVRAPVDLGPDYDQLWGSANPYGSYINSNLSPHFPYAAAIWTAMWQKKTGQHLDGAIALDPAALGYLLGVTGPAQLPDRTEVTAGNVVALTQQAAYARFGSDTDARKAFLLAVARAVASRVLDYRGGASSLLDAATRASDERRLLVWSDDPALEAQLAPTPVSGVVPDGPGAYAGLALDNVAGDKLDYYLDRSVRYQATGCGRTRTVTVTATLTNSAPASGLSAYATGQTIPHPRVRPGETELDVAYLATAGATVSSVTVDGQAVPVTAGVERGHPVVRMDLTIPQGATRTVVYHLVEPRTPGTVTVLRQPLVRPIGVTVDLPTC